MANGLLYSTNPFLKYFVQDKYFKRHYVWCASYFDPRNAPGYTGARMVAPSSSPCLIYQALRAEVFSGERHSYKIAEQSTSMLGRAGKWLEQGLIKEQDHKDIVHMIAQAHLGEWRPLIYVIPTKGLGKRIKEVPVEKRASFGEEYIVEDLKTTEFDIIELP